MCSRGRCGIITREPSELKEFYADHHLTGHCRHHAAAGPRPRTAFAACGGHGLLFDCGEGTQAAARRAGVNLMRADAVCLTHYHGDHIFGLPGCCRRWGPRAAPGRCAGGAEGLAGIWSAVRALTGPLPYAVRLQEADGPLALDALSEGWPAGAVLRPFATQHRVPSVGYRLELPRAGKFSPARARALGVPVQQWKLLQQGQSVPVKAAPWPRRRCWARRAGG